MTEYRARFSTLRNREAAATSFLILLLALGIAYLGTTGGASDIEITTPNPDIDIQENNPSPENGSGNVTDNSSTNETNESMMCGPYTPDEMMCGNSTR